MGELVGSFLEYIVENGEKISIGAVAVIALVIYAVNGWSIRKADREDNITSRLKAAEDGQTSRQQSEERMALVTEMVEARVTTTAAYTEGISALRDGYSESTRAVEAMKAEIAATTAELRSLTAEVRKITSSFTEMSSNMTGVPEAIRAIPEATALLVSSKLEEVLIVNMQQLREEVSSIRTALLKGVNVRLGVFTIDQVGVVLSINEEAGAMLSSPDSSLVGDNIYDKLDIRQILNNDIGGVPVLNSPTPIKNMLIGVLNKKSEVWRVFMASTLPTCCYDGDLKMTVVTLLDIGVEARVVDKDATPPPVPPAPLVDTAPKVDEVVKDEGAKDA